MTGLIIRGATALRAGRWVDESVAMRDGRLVEPSEGADVVIDAAGLLVAPGLIDLQCNGGLGIDLASEPEQLWDLATVLPRWGVTAWLPTIVTSPPRVAERALAALASGQPAAWTGAVPLGLHLEGPFLAPAKRGAHDPTHLTSPDLEAIGRWSRDAGVTLVTLAPELAGARAVVQALVDRGVIVSLGHSAASAAQARDAVDWGARWVTHLFNAMAPLHHREPGLAGVALTDERLHVGLIADGVHVAPAMVAVAQRALGPRLTLVTDAVAALGMPPSRLTLGRAEVTVGDDGVRLADGTLAGSALSLDQAVRNLVAFTGCPTETALHAASAAAAELLGDTARGTLAPGARADLVVLTRDLEVVMTVVAGRIAYDAR
jgi:N-acetylglucosamine-6-phosphate deacetylase